MPPRIDGPPLLPSDGDDEAAALDALDASAAYLSHWIEDAQQPAQHDHGIKHRAHPLDRNPHCRRGETLGDLPRDLPPPPFGSGRRRPRSPQCVGQRHGFCQDDGSGANQTSSQRPPLSRRDHYARRHSDEGRQPPAGRGHGGQVDDFASSIHDFASSFRSAFGEGQRQHQHPATASRRAVSFRVRRRRATSDDGADGPGTSGPGRTKSKSEHGTRSSRGRTRCPGNPGAGDPSQEAGRRPPPAGRVDAEDHRDHPDAQALRRDSLRSHGTVSTGCTGGTLSPIPYARDHRPVGAVKSILKPSAYRGRGGGAGAVRAAAAAAGERRPMILADRALGDAVTSSDVLHPLPPDPFRALRVHDFVWIRRTNGCWTYAIFSDFRTVRGEDAMRFVTDFRGSTKTLRGKKLGKSLRLVGCCPAVDSNGDSSVGTGGGSVPSDVAVASLLNDLGNLDLHEHGRERRRGMGDATCGTRTVDPSEY